MHTCASSSLNDIRSILHPKELHLNAFAESFRPVRIHSIPVPYHTITPIAKTGTKHHVHHASFLPAAEAGGAAVCVGLELAELVLGVLLSVGVPTVLVVVVVKAPPCVLVVTNALPPELIVTTTTPDASTDSAVVIADPAAEAAEPTADSAVEMADPAAEAAEPIAEDAPAAAVLRTDSAEEMPLPMAEDAPATAVEAAEMAEVTPVGMGFGIGKMVIVWPPLTNVEMAD